MNAMWLCDSKKVGPIEGPVELPVTPDRWENLETPKPRLEGWRTLFFPQRPEGINPKICKPSHCECYFL